MIKKMTHKDAMDLIRKVREIPFDELFTGTALIKDLSGESADRIIVAARRAFTNLGADADEGGDLFARYIQEMEDDQTASSEGA